MSLPYMTRDVALQLEQSKGDHIESWLQGMQEQLGNPFGVEILQMKNARALLLATCKKSACLIR